MLMLADAWGPSRREVTSLGLLCSASRAHLAISSLTTGILKDCCLVASITTRGKADTGRPARPLPVLLRWWPGCLSPGFWEERACFSCCGYGCRHIKGKGRRGGTWEGCAATLRSTRMVGHCSIARGAGMWGASLLLCIQTV